VCICVHAKIEAILELLLVCDEVVQARSKPLDLVSPDPRWDIGCLLRLSLRRGGGEPPEAFGVQDREAEFIAHVPKSVELYDGLRELTDRNARWQLFKDFGIPH